MSLNQPKLELCCSESALRTGFSQFSHVESWFGHVGSRFGHVGPRLAMLGPRLAGLGPRVASLRQVWPV